MKVRRVPILIATLAVISIGASGQNAPLGALTPVADATFTDTRAIEIAKALAEKYNVVIGVSGVLIGSDARLVSVSIHGGTMKDVLDAIVKADPRFTWRQEDDGGIALLTRGASLSVLDVMVKAFDAEHPPRFGLSTQIISLPEVTDWLQKNSCQMAEIIRISGGPGRTDVWPVKLHLKDIRLEALLNIIALESKTYFWSALEYNDHPCAINIRP
jgi:hypothetical protein